LLEVVLETGRVEDAGADALLVHVLEGEDPSGTADAVDRAAGGIVRQAIAAGLVRGRLGETRVLPTYGRIPSPRIVVSGLGPRGNVQSGAALARRTVAEAAREARRSGARSVAFTAAGSELFGMDPEAAAEAAVLGIRHGLWRYDGYRTGERSRPQVESLLLYESDPDRAPLVGAGLRRGQILADAVALTREIAVLGSNDKYPERVAERARAYAAQVGLDIQVLDERDLAEMGAGAILGVGQGSVHPPRMVVLRTGGTRADGPVLGLVGKGITFDSGGISLKAAAGMEEMKYDLCGAAAVLAAMGALARLGSPIPVVGVMCLAENLPSGSAQRPGDVVRSLDGRTIEVINTDAEGRLVMADGLALARRMGATHLVDVATLTGACVTALGHAYSGLMSNDEGLAHAVEEAASQACEKVWRLPLTDERYETAMDSDIADVRNTSRREVGAGAITAGIFLRHFADGRPWVHLDIAGTAWITQGPIAMDAGPTGAMCETLVRLPSVLAGG